MNEQWLFLLLAAIGIFLFWRLRQQEEWARNSAKQLCQRQQLQMLDVALVKRQWQKGKLLHHYLLDFSLAPEERYQAHFVMHGRRVIDVQWPVMREIFPT
ncbi:DUF3301 domain-containing protein [Gallaecimonas mangrovi]|uniref:DUF3301 domain-containing protein n=1 Tax=Gallaecimonas mangrovi TaxID=2291597 RepID=UPI000E203BE6|nr:DUF3301 domain-containing protein [Gallaecimonas mangrovi]